jgi:hypothetical protein
VKRHRFDPFSFLFGALFLVVGGTFLFGRSGLDVARPERMWAGATAVIGVTLAVWAVSRAIRRATAEEDRGDTDAVTSGAEDPDPASATLPDEGPGELGTPS